MNRVVFLGVGALGSHAALLCRNLDAKLALVDFDRVESKNTLSQAFVKASIGKHKAEALKLQLASFWGIRADAFNVRVTDANVATICQDAKLLVDAFDNASSRRLVAAHARARGLPLVHAALSGDGTFGVVRWDERFEADEEDEVGAATCEGGEHLPIIGTLSATLARAVDRFLRDGTRLDAMVTSDGVLPTACA